MLKLENFGFYRIYRHSKEIITQILKEFFENLDKQTSFLMPTIKSFEWSDKSEESKINVYKDWFEQIRSVPFIVVSLSDFKERILEFEQTNSQLLGLENLVVKQTSTGLTSTGLVKFGIAADMNARIVLGVEDSDARMDLIDILFTYFTLYGKNIKVFKSANGLHDFIFSVPKKPIRLSGETEIDVGKGTITRIYAAEMIVPVYIEAYYRLNITDIISGLQYEGILKTS